MVRKVCSIAAADDPNEKIIVTEYGVEMTGAEFLAEDDRIVFHDYTSFGKRFC